jgi:D-amino-acid dehydrogenase
MTRVVVVGAGVIGLASAWALRKRGADVVVLERGLPGMGASAGNAGWIVPSMSTPLPAPGLVRTSLKWMLHNDSPLYIKPRFNPSFARWMWGFYRNCRPGPFEAGMNALVELNRRTFPMLDQMRADGVAFEMHSAGLLYVGLTRENVVNAHEHHAVLERYGYRLPPILDAVQVHALEPSLAPEVAGGFHLEDERHVRPESFTAGLVEWLTERGVEVRSGVEVTGIERQGGGVRAVATNLGPIEADAVLLAAGAWSGAVAKRMGFALPMEAGKGYSITIDQPPLDVRHPLDMIEARAAITPFDGALRVAGTMELSGLNVKLLQPRVEAIRRAGRRYLAGWQDGGKEHVWVGMRPLSPDGLPIIGRVPGAGNLFAATGHQMLGVTLAPATVYVHGTELRASSGPGELLSRRLALQCAALRRAQRVFVNSHATGELLRAHVPDVEFRVRYPCYDPRRIYDPARHTENPYRAASGAFVLLTVSRVVERKGHDDVLRLLARIDGQLPPYRYYVVGDGPHRPVLQRRAHELGLSERVVFTGSVPTEQLGAYFHHADLFIMLSRPARTGFEGFGLAYVEAGLSGTAAVGSAHGGAVEAVQHDVTGWIVDTEQKERAAKDLLALAWDPNRRRRYADAARAWAMRELDPTRFARDLLGQLGGAP